ncbi:hypothetical protein OMP38_11230 [Cohnella ginsengisoli]|uniref:Uncharacterized protein n=1 Tax=Cohnella ginsengisoli TaxID=425004 RepID=A0A9X4QMI5_9BACL|nr:hypothetical protein [Cohnella ginsengisoli]MDG0791376.1 hypothetical protein [Cohnella ginsengisoli]
MMNSSPLTDARAQIGSTERPPRRAARRSVVPFVLLWLLLIGAGVACTIWYTGQQREQVSAQLQQQTASQIAALQQDYRARLDKLESDYAAQMAQLSSKVDALNELLTFTQDNASDKTDNSNKLYTQISELKKQLDQLKKELDVLK